MRRPALARALALELARAAGVRGMVGGQSEDLAAEGQRPDAARLERLHRGQDGGALRRLVRGRRPRGGRHPSAGRGACGRFGLELGLAFQIVDDVLDETGTAASLGKTPGKDRRGRKMTYVALEGVDGALTRARRRLATALASIARLPRPAALEALARYVVARDR